MREPWTDDDSIPYLNCCEGKAHLDLTEHQEVKQKLRDHGFDTNFAEKRFVRSLMDDLRAAVLPDPSKPDASIFARYFSAPKAPSPSGPKKTAKKNKKSVVVEPRPEPRIPIMRVDTLSDGFRLRANPEFKAWPANVRVQIAYADGGQRPKWSRFDFKLADLNVQISGGSKPQYKDNVIVLQDCGADFALEVTGFDANRELVTTVSAHRAAATEKGTADA
ncbi:hypothetical protein [Phenylobacterium sp.]|uniref:hypothetical protein n=1 Tax=Phenylobacterium sp. TaxID=1871053 RepID=UPI003561E3C3